MTFAVAPIEGVQFLSVILEPGSDPVDQAVDARERRGGFRSRLRFRTAVRGFSARLNPAQVARLRADDQVVSVTANRTVRATETLAANETVPTGVQRIGARPCRRSPPTRRARSASASSTPASTSTTRT